MALHTLALFCRVVDNFGDIGVCWRLARQLQREYSVQVQLWVDDLRSFQTLCPQVDVNAVRQSVFGIDILHWCDAALDLLSSGEVAVSEAVIEGFGCALPEAYFAQMRTQARAPVWLNLEYLSAESWVESCHALPSIHPQTGMRKHFFFPGFSAQTGGLLAESDLAARRTAFQANTIAQQHFWQSLPLQPASDEINIGLFCYPGAPLAELFDAWQSGPQKILCSVAQGVVSEKIAAFLQQPALAGAHGARGNLRLQVLPFIEQSAYDQLLWAMDLNFVRGEDSFVRAQWAARPMLWHIYPQEEGAHLDKLDAFLARYSSEMSPELASACREMSLMWNGVGQLEQLAASWQRYCTLLPQFRQAAIAWETSLQQNGHLAANLMQMIAKLA
ncbi:MAG: elongation factor P maturation arginine rhamnosyltransferase EarP [Burkholderiales bacterium]|nr:elongation factor P maturation arginine rhamnosyltransferase EarP [Burkholderiales bacterium]